MGDGAAEQGRQAGRSRLLHLGFNRSPVCRARSSWQRRSYQSLDSGLSACWVTSGVTRGMCRESSHAAAASLRSLLGLAAAACFCLLATDEWHEVGASPRGQPRAHVEATMMFCPSVSKCWVLRAGQGSASRNRAAARRGDATLPSALCLSLSQPGKLQRFSQITCQSEGDGGLWFLPQLPLSFPLGQQGLALTTAHS